MGGFDHLPVELVVAIFTHTTYIEPAYPLLLLLVCRNWANLVVQTPSLWTQVSIDETKTDFIDRAFTHIHYSRDAQINVSISGRRITLLPVLEFLFANKWNQISSFTWTNSSPKYEEEMSAILAKMTGLSSLGVGRIGYHIIDTLPNLRRLDRLEVILRATMDVSRLLKAVCVLPTLYLIHVKVSGSTSGEIPLDNFSLQRLRVGTLIFNSSLPNAFPLALNDSSVHSILSNPFVRHVDLQASALDRLQLPPDFKPVAIQSLRLGTASFIERAPQLIRSLSKTLKSLCLAFPTSQDGIIRVLRELPKLNKLEEFEWAGSYIDQGDVTLTLGFSPILPHLLRLTFWATASIQVLSLLTIQAPLLEYLRIESSTPALVKMQHSPAVQEVLRSFLRRSPRISTALLWGLPLADVDQHPILVEVPFLTRLEVYTNSLSSLSSFSSHGQSINLSITVAEDSLIDRNLAPSAVLGGTFFGNVETLTFQIAHLYNHFLTFATSLHLFSHLRVLSIYGFAHHIKHVDKILNILHNERACPELEELHISKYPDWQILLGFISSRNSRSTLGPRAGATAFLAIGLPRQPHPTIHHAIQRALKGEPRVVMDPWIIPPEMLSSLCLGCKAARIHTCQWSDQDEDEGVLSQEEYCVRHPPRAKLVITRDSPRL